jgi:tRNA threonylcarbamoyladenosine biosynthesis protein TsaB
MANILLVDTSSRICRVALHSQHGFWESVEELPQSHARRLLGMIEQLLRTTRLSLERIDAFAVIAGPGSFTGLRIGMGAVQGLAMASQRPVILLSALESLAHTAIASCNGTGVLVALSAREGEIYFAAYSMTATGELITQLSPRVIALDTIKLSEAELPEGKWLGVGSGWQYAEQICRVIACNPVQIRKDLDLDMQILGKLAQVKYLAGDTVLAENVLPIYLQDELDYK